PAGARPAAPAARRRRAGARSGHGAARRCAASGGRVSQGSQFRDRPLFRIEKGSVPKLQGIALVGVLWILALLTVSAAALSAALREDLRLTGNLIAAAQARRAAEGGVELVLARLIGGPQPGSSGSRLGVAGSPPSSFRLGEAHVEVAFVDEA